MHTLARVVSCSGVRILICIPSPLGTPQNDEDAIRIIEHCRYVSKAALKDCPKSYATYESKNREIIVHVYFAPRIAGRPET